MKNNQTNKKRTTIHKLNVLLKIHIKKWNNFSRTAKVWILFLGMLILTDILALTIQNYFPMMGHPPIPWRYFLRERWGSFLAYHIFLGPIGFLQYAFMEERTYNARQKEKEKKRQQYKKKKNTDEKDTN